MLNQNNHSSSSEALKKIINEKDKIYSPLSLFLIIDKNLEKDKTIILKYFDAVLSIDSLEKEDLNLLKLKKAIFISDTSNESKILILLNPIIPLGTQKVLDSLSVSKELKNLSFIDGGNVIKDEIEIKDLDILFKKIKQ